MNSYKIPGVDVLLTDKEKRTLEAQRSDVSMGGWPSKTLLENTLLSREKLLEVSALLEPIYYNISDLQIDEEVGTTAKYDILGHDCNRRAMDILGPSLDSNTYSDINNALLSEIERGIENGLIESLEKVPAACVALMQPYNKWIYGDRGPQEIMAHLIDKTDALINNSENIGYGNLIQNQKDTDTGRYMKILISDETFMSVPVDKARTIVYVNNPTDMSIDVHLRQTYGSLSAPLHVEAQTNIKEEVLRGIPLGSDPMIRDHMESTAFSFETGFVDIQNLIKICRKLEVDGVDISQVVSILASTYGCTATLDAIAMNLTASTSSDVRKFVLATPLPSEDLITGGVIYPYSYAISKILLSTGVTNGDVQSTTTEIELYHPEGTTGFKIFEKLTNGDIIPRSSSPKPHLAHTEIIINEVVRSVSLDGKGKLTNKRTEILHLKNISSKDDLELLQHNLSLTESEISNHKDTALKFGSKVKTLKKANKSLKEKLAASNRKIAKAEEEKRKLNKQIRDQDTLMKAKASEVKIETRLNKLDRAIIQDDRVLKQNKLFAEHQQKTAQATRNNWALYAGGLAMLVFVVFGGGGALMTALKGAAVLLGGIKSFT